jgi:hypothetical protein
MTEVAQGQDLERHRVQPDDPRANQVRDVVESDDQTRVVRLAEDPDAGQNVTACEFAQGDAFRRNLSRVRRVRRVNHCRRRCHECDERVYVVYVHVEDPSSTIDDACLVPRQRGSEAIPLASLACFDIARVREA